MTLALPAKVSVARWPAKALNGFLPIFFMHNKKLPVYLYQGDKTLEYFLKKSLIVNDYRADYKVKQLAGISESGPTGLQISGSVWQAAIINT